MQRNTLRDTVRIKMGHLKMVKQNVAQIFSFFRKFHCT